MSKPTEDTVVEIQDLDLEAILNPGAASVMLPDEPKKNIFSKTSGEDLSFLNTKKEDTPPAAATTTTELDDEGTIKVTTVSSTEIDELINEDDTQKTNTGRPKMEKNGLIELATSLIEKKLLVPFDDDKPLEKYTIQDFQELFEANDEDKKNRLREEVATEFWTNLPEEVQYAGKYLAEGGQDLKGLFRTLAAVEEVRQLDPTNDHDQKNIVRSYLQSTNFGTPEEIEEEIDSWEDRGELEAKAKKFKPKLDALSEKQVQYKLQQQAKLRDQQSKQAQMYMDNIYKTLEPAELNGLKLDKKTQNLLFSGLVQPNYPSVSGKQTNLLGHLLEKYQFVEPNHGLVAEALWLLADPDGYKNRVRENTKKEVVADTVRKLKSEEKAKIASHVEDEEIETPRPTNRIPRATKDFFKR
jgi:hypothetical protein